jgi:hypothetical protein
MRLVLQSIAFGNKEDAMPVGAYIFANSATGSLSLAQTSSTARCPLPLSPLPTAAASRIDIQGRLTTGGILGVSLKSLLDLPAHSGLDHLEGV